MRDDSTKRRIREGASRAMRSKVRHCAECNRGQVPHVEDFGGGIAWTCRYCGHENGHHVTEQPMNPEALRHSCKVAAIELEMSRKGANHD